MKLFKSNWGQWTDISTSGYMEYRCVLQARRHKNGKLQYRLEKINEVKTCQNPTLEQLEKVTFKQQEQ